MERVTPPKVTPHQQVKALQMSLIMSQIKGQTKRWIWTLRMSWSFLNFLIPWQAHQLKKKTKRPRDVWSLKRNVDEGSSSTKSKTTRNEKYKKGSFVVARYEGEWYPAQICQDQNNTEVETIRLSFMAIRGMNVFQWPDKEDIFVWLIWVT